jgi:hypothetical protein
MHYKVRGPLSATGTSSVYFSWRSLQFVTKQALNNVRIEWLPANTTSHWQPLDQGIIAGFKLQYRAQWVAYMLRQYEANKDPNQTVSLLKAIQWTRLAWDQGVSEATIQKCWWKSTIIKRPVDQEAKDQCLQQERDKLQAQMVTYSFQIFQSFFQLMSISL